jgi:hypothetical protein
MDFKMIRPACLTKGRRINRRKSSRQTNVARAQSRRIDSLFRNFENQILTVSVKTSRRRSAPSPGKRVCDKDGALVAAASAWLDKFSTAPRLLQWWPMRLAPRTAALLACAARTYTKESALTPTYHQQADTSAIRLRAGHLTRIDILTGAARITQSKLRVSPRQFAATFVFASFPFARLRSSKTRLRSDDKPHTVRRCKCCNERDCNTDMVARFPSLLGKQL